MKLLDLIESPQLRKSLSYTLPPTYVMPGLPNNDSYTQYRHLVALASARAMQNNNHHMDPELMWGQDQSVVCYTPDDEETLRLANKLMKVTSIPLTTSVSQEMPDRQIVSPVRSFIDLIVENYNSFDNMSNIEHTYGTISKLILDADSANELSKWCIEHNIPCLDTNKLHCTVLFSTNPVKKLTAVNGYKLDIVSKIHGWKKLGSALTLELTSPKIRKIHNWMIKQGGTHDYPTFISHMTVDYAWGEDKPVPNNFPDIKLKFVELEVDAINPKYAVESTKDQLNK